MGEGRELKTEGQEHTYDHDPPAGRRPGLASSVLAAQVISKYPAHSKDYSHIYTVTEPNTTHLG